MSGVDLNRRGFGAGAAAALLVAGEGRAQSIPAAPPGWSDAWPPKDVIRLWPDDPPGWRGPVTPVLPTTWPPNFLRGTASPTLNVFRPVKPNGQALLVCPGGAYMAVSAANEGLDVARMFNALGFTVFVLAYRLPGEGWNDRADVPPTGHMAAAATISVEPATFQALLTDICRSYKAHGFTDIILVGDSGSSQAGMEAVAADLNRRWVGERARVHYLREYYAEDKWSYAFLKSKGIVQIDKTPPAGEAPDQPRAVRNGLHDDIYYEAQVAVQDPALIRMDERRKAGLFSLHGVELDPLSQTLQLGRELARYRAQITKKAFQESQKRLRSK